MRHQKCHLRPIGDDATDPVNQPPPATSHIQLSSNTSSVLPTPSHMEEHPNCEPSFTFSTSLLPLHEFHLVPGPFEECLPKHLIERNHNIRSMWNDGALKLNVGLGDSPAVLKKKMNIVERRLYVPTASGESPTLASPPAPATSSSHQQSKIAPSSSPGLTLAASPDPGLALAASPNPDPAASPSSHPGLTPNRSSAAESETGQLCQKFWCEICQKGFKDNDHLRRHRKSKHEPRYKILFQQRLQNYHRYGCTMFSLREILS